MPRKLKKAPEVVPVAEVPERKLPVRLLFIVSLVLILGVLVWRNKGLFVAATVNGEPLWRLSLERQLVNRFGEQTIDEIVGEMLIRQAAAQNKIKVDKVEVDNKLSEIEKTLNGQISLKDALAQQGDTLESFRQRIELQLILEKLTAGQVTVNDQEITDYMDKNKASMTATDEAGLKAEARQTILSGKRNDIIRKYFQDLKSKAKISKFL